ncbi:uncharacterized protein L969DRAFT_103935 [Mixia osmundae IAM 14324]|uniref:Uncharacterized protein n=1 Tax=Mixia osmundae (strain CBS 9802 / IAM 14324 / JCM 22182 / KY 12970) TaxID=764103 RepID=G7E753_MIXOS|nr:uncharacterized protein L969DRAFT_103935 [Mixia osmundae IAM 14324]KEI38950.1 hypothetical protein L969DRAFT_103935 [Mixia osmundae IAM 14324]GAA98663.1 hypothetical protein E5Q_05351 [Mixia osmundae IAM 14324]
MTSSLVDELLIVNMEHPIALFGRSKRVRPALEWIALSYDGQTAEAGPDREHAAGERKARKELLRGVVHFEFVKMAADAALSYQETLEYTVQALQAIADALHSQARSAAPASEQESTLKRALPHFATLKSVNRAASENVQECKARSAEARSLVDEAFMGLQNLKYEKEFLEREIRSCKDYDSQFDRLELHTVDDFARLSGAPKAESMDTDETKPIPDDPHELMLARLHFELSERQRLEREKKTLLSQKVTLTKSNDEKRAKLEALEKKLEEFVESAKVIQSNLAQVQ